MVILHVTVQVKPEHVSEFLEVVRYDAAQSNRASPGRPRGLLGVGASRSQRVGVRREVGFLGAVR